MTNKKHLHDSFGSCTEPQLQPGSLSTEPIAQPQCIDHADPAPGSRIGLAMFLEKLLGMVGMMQSTVKEFPGLVRLVAGPDEDEVTLHIDMAPKPYAVGDEPSLQRIVTLSVRLDHDYRLLGNGYYCIDCDLPQNDTVH